MQLRTPYAHYQPGAVFLGQNETFVLRGAPAIHHIVSVAGMGMKTVSGVGVSRK
jgi:hypothetical protein